MDFLADFIHVKIGGVFFSIEVINKSKAPILLQENDPAYQSFFKNFNIKKDEKKNVSVRLELKSEEMLNPKELVKKIKIFDSDQSWSILRDSKTSDIYWIILHPPIHKKPLWAAQFNRDISEVTVYCSPQIYREKDGKMVISNPFRYPLDQLLLMYFLAQHQGAVIHAAGIAINGKGFIFPGRSGAGKSTLSRLFTSREDHEHLEVFSDERMVIRKINGIFTAFGTPWSGEAQIARNKSIPLSGIFFLHHAANGPPNKIIEIKQKKALEKLLPVISIPWYDREVMPKVLQFCEDLVSNVPCFDLHFTPGIEVVKCLEEFKKF